MKQQIIAIIVLAMIVCGMAYCSAANNAEGAPTIVDSEKDIELEKRNLHIASAYACGMLDALQEKRKRATACDEYREIARKRGVSVPP